MMRFDFLCRFTAAARQYRRLFGGGAHRVQRPLPRHMGYCRKLAAAAFAVIGLVRAASAAPDIDALLRQDGFEADHPADGFWSIWFSGDNIGKFQVCLTFAANGRNLLAFVPLIDKTEIPPDTKFPFVRLLQERAVGIASDKAGGLIVYEVVPGDRINATAIKSHIEGVAGDAIWTYGQLRSYLSAFHEPSCSGQPAP